MVGAVFDVGAAGDGLAGGYLDKFCNIWGIKLN